MLLKKTTTATGAGLLAALALSACGGDSERLCAIYDASSSTAYAQAAYGERLQEAVNTAAEGGGSVRAIVVTGDPMAESDVLRADFQDLTGTERAAKRRAAVAEFLDEVDTEVTDARGGARNPTSGSGLVGSLKLMDGQGCTRVEMYSDGYESRDFSVFRDDIVSDRGRGRLVARLEDDGGLGDFDGAELVVPFGGYHPQGTDLPRDRRQALEPLWGLIAARAHARLDWGR